MGVIDREQCRWTGGPPRLPSRVHRAYVDGGRRLRRRDGEEIPVVLGVEYVVGASEEAGVGLSLQEGLQERDGDADAGGVEDSGGVELAGEGGQGFRFNVETLLEHSVLTPEFSNC